jgi:hypothetical protein
MLILKAIINTWNELIFDTFIWKLNIYVLNIWGIDI